MNNAGKVIEMMDWMESHLWFVTKMTALVESAKGVKASLSFSATEAGSWSLILQSNAGVWGSKIYTRIQMEWLEETERVDEAIHEFFERGDAIYDRYLEAVRLIEEHRNEIGVIKITETKVECLPDNGLMQEMGKADKLTEIEEECLCYNWLRKDRE